MAQPRRHSVVAVMVGSVCLIACASSTPAPRPHTEPLALPNRTGMAAGAPQPAVGNASAGGVTPGGPGAAGVNVGVLDAGKAVLGAATVVVYDASDQKGDVVAVATGVPDCHCSGRTWWVREYRNAPGGEAEREMHYTFDADGNLAQTEEIDREDKVEVVYTPALVIVPDKLRLSGASAAEKGGAFTQTVEMVVHPLGDRSKVRMRGPMTSEIRYAGDEGIKTGEGTIAAHRIMTTLTADLKAAKTVDTIEQWWADGIGLVGQKEEEVTKVFGAKVRDNALTLVMKRREQK